MLENDGNLLISLLISDETDTYESVVGKKAISCFSEN